mgnify:CR=1 FL=1
MRTVSGAPKVRELFNIDIEYVFLAAKEQYDERVNLMLASGDLPDVMNVSRDTDASDDRSRTASAPY